jgi:hypothetical protein
LPCLELIPQEANPHADSARNAVNAIDFEAERQARSPNGSQCGRCHAAALRTIRIAAELAWGNLTFQISG